MSTVWERIARAAHGDGYAATYAQRFREMAADGHDIHGEATFVQGVLAPPARVLDAGCGTGRIAIHLQQQGYVVVGIDVDESMLAQARTAAPDLDWRAADLATMDLRQSFELVLLAGNVIPLLEAETLRQVALRLAAHTAPGGHVVCGFGLSAEHLPAGCPPTPLAEVDAAFAEAGLVPVRRWAGWDRAAYAKDAGYVVTIHHRDGA